MIFFPSQQLRKEEEEKREHEEYLKLKEAFSVEEEGEEELAPDLSVYLHIYILCYIDKLNSSYFQSYLPFTRAYENFF